jgi:pilus assembly protein CpaF
VAIFSVIISEKGGAERRESFDRTEINVGRVQGNDLMLPKGNVSKRHARLLCRDGRFIVTDLKSTNGTYVNGRKIAQATIVREGDKIYIGDFVLRIEAGAAAGVAPQAGSSPIPSPPTDDGIASDLQSAPPGPPIAAPPAVAPTSASLPAAALVQAGAMIPPAPADAPPAPFPNPAPPAAAPFAMGPQAAPNPAPPAAAPFAMAVPNPAPPTPAVGMVLKGGVVEPPSSSQPSSAAERALRVPRIEPKTGDRHEVISHFPLEHDPDESVHFAVPAPPRVPSAPRPIPKPAPSSMGPQAAPNPAPPAAAPSSSGVAVPSPMTAASPKLVQAAPVPAPADPAVPPRIPPQPPLPAPPAAAAYEVPPGPPVAPTKPVPPGPTAPPTPFYAGPSAPGATARPSAPGEDRSTSPSVGLASLLHAPPAGYDLGPARRPRPSAAPPGIERAPVDAARVAAHRAALAALVERAGELVDLRPLADGSAPDRALASQIDRALVEGAAPLRDRGDLDVDALLGEARREICEYGPLTLPLDDEDVTEIQLIRHDYVVAMHGQRQVPADVGFTSEEAAARAIRRLALAAGRPVGDGNDMFVERRLPRGQRMFAVLPRSADRGHVVVIKKPQRADLTLEDLVRSGTISRAMAGLFAQCVAARANILVTGAVGAGTTTLLGALAAAGSTEDRVVVLEEDDELIFNQPHTISLLLGETSEERARAVHAAARIQPDRLVVGAFAGPVAAELVDAMGDGVDGVLAGARAPTLRQAVLRLTADIAATKPGVSTDVAREWLSSVFDLAIEVARLRDGRHRVLRVAELGIEGGRVVMRDIFTFNVERTAAGGAIEGTFTPSGVVPAVLEDLAARGVPVDPSIFRRHGRAETPSSAGLSSDPGKSPRP